jgi:hypothetical protein
MTFLAGFALGALAVIGFSLLAMSDPPDSNDKE